MADFKLIKECVDVSVDEETGKVVRKAAAVPVYGGKKIKSGQTIKLSGHLAEKARNNPDFEEVLADPNAK